METSIGAYVPETRSVPVTFTVNGLTHTRDVNACHDEAGAYDVAATAKRVEAVGRGVLVKVSLGVIRPAPDPIELPAMQEIEPTE